MGNNSIKDHTVKFRRLLTKSKLDKTSQAIIDYYRETLNLLLQKRLLGLEVSPTTLQEWYDKATKYDNLFQKSSKSRDEGGPTMIRKKSQRRKPGRSPKKTPMQWM